MPIVPMPNYEAEMQMHNQNIFSQLLSNMMLQRMAQSFEQKKLDLDRQQKEQALQATLLIHGIPSTPVAGESQPQQDQGLLGKLFGSMLGQGPSASQTPALNTATSEFVNQQFGMPNQPQAQASAQPPASSGQKVRIGNIEATVPTSGGPPRVYPITMPDGTVLPGGIVPTKNGVQYIPSAKPTSGTWMMHEETGDLVNVPNIAGTKPPPGYKPANMYESGSSEAAKQPFPVTDKGWTISTDKQGVNYAKRVDDQGNLISEPYNPNSHGKAIQAAQSQRDALQEEAIYKPEEIKTFVDKIKTGQATTDDVSLLGGRGFSGQINRQNIARELANDPNFNFKESRMMSKYISNPQVFMGLVQINAVRPRVEALRDKFKEIGNLDVMPVNTAKNAIKKQFGNEAIADFEATRTQVVFELQRALTGIGMMTDSRVEKELANLNMSYSPGQMNKSIDAINEILDTRFKALLGGPIPGTQAIGGQGYNPPAAPSAPSVPQPGQAQPFDFKKFYK